MKQTVFRISLLFALIVTVGILVSCPEPFAVSDLDILEDTFGPQLIITSPAEGSMFQEKVAVSGTALDVNGIGELRGIGDEAAIPLVTWSVSGKEATGAVAVNNDGTFAMEIPSSDYDEDITIIFTAVDTNGNESVVLRRLLYDNRGPVIAVDSPVDRSIFGKTVSVTGTVANSDGGSPTNIAALAYEVVNTAIQGGCTFDDETGVFSFDFDTTGIETDILVRIFATDYQEDSTTYTLQLMRATNGPVISITSPGNFSDYGLRVDVTGSVTNKIDDDGTDLITKLSYEVLNTAIGNDALEFDETGAFSFFFETAGLSGDLVIVVAAEDIHGLVTSTVIDLNHDEAGPEITVTAPAQQSIYAKRVDVTGTVSNGPGDASLDQIASLSYEVVNSAISDDLLDFSTGTFSFSFDTDGLSGDLIVRITAVDVHGDSTTETLVLEADRVGPAITILNPANYSYVTALVEVSGTIQNSVTDSALDSIDAESITYEVVGTTIAGIPAYVHETGVFSFSFDTTGLTSGLIIRVAADDINGYSSTETLFLEPDNRGPEITVSDPVNYSIYGAYVNVTGTVTNGPGDTNLDKIPEGALLSYQVSGTAVSGTATISEVDGSFSFGFATTGFSTDLVVEMRATDIHEDETVKNLNLKTDTEGPAITISSPASYTNYGFRVDVDGTVANKSDDTGTDMITQLSYEVLNTAISVDTLAFDAGTGGFSFFFETDGLSGNLVVLITAKDIHGRTTVSTLELIHDTEGPDITVTSPAPQSIYARQVDVAGTIANGPGDAGVDLLAGLSYEVVNTAIGGTLEYTAGSFSFGFETGGLSGDLIVRITGVDIHGDESVETLVLEPDEVGPYISISTPGNYSDVTATVNVTGTIRNGAADTGLDSIDAASITYEVVNTAITGSPSYNELTGAFSFSFDTTGLAGDLIVRVNADDINGYTTTETLILEADEIGPAINVSSPTNHSVYDAYVTIAGTVLNGEEDSGLDKIPVDAVLAYEVSGTTINGTTAINPGNGSFTFGFDTTGLSGNLVVEMRAADIHGDETVENLYLDTDGTGPLITISSPDNYSVFEVWDIEVTGTVVNGEGDSNLDEIDTVTFSALNGEQTGVVDYSLLDGGFTFNVDATGRNTGIVITVTATDIHGYISTTTLVLQNDDTGPYITLTSPLDGYLSTVIFLEGQIQSSESDTTLDQVDLASVSYQIPGTAVNYTFLPGEIDASGNFSAEIDTSTITTNVVFEVSALDMNGNESVVQVNLLQPAGGGDVNVIADVRNGEIFFTWDPVPGATGYRIEEFVYGGIKDGLTDADAAGYTWEGLTNGAFHEFQVSATIPGYDTAVSSDIVIAPMSGMTFRPWQVNDEYGTIAIEWTPSETVGARYLLERQVNNGTWEALTVTTANSYTDTDVVKANYYRYRLTLRDNGQDPLNESIESVAFRSPYFSSEISVANQVDTTTFYTVEKYGDKLILSDSSNNLYAYTLTDPLAPELSDTLTNKGTLFHLHGSTAYCFRDNSNKVYMVDVATMTSPDPAYFEVDYLGTILDIQAITSSGTTLYIGVSDRNAATTTGKVFIYDITTPEAPEPVSSFSAEPVGLYAGGGYLYIAKEATTNVGTLVVADVTTPGSVSPVDTGLEYNRNNSSTNRVPMTMSGDYLFIHDSTLSMRAYNVSTPETPSEVARGLGGTLYGDGDMSIDGNTLYIADDWSGGGYKAFDITHILNGDEDSVPEGSEDTNEYTIFDYAYPLETYTRDFVIDSGVMWIVQSNLGITVVELGIPTTFSEVASGELSLSGGAGDTNGIMADGDRLVAASGDSGTVGFNMIHVLDISADPEAPIETTYLDLGNSYNKPEFGITGDTVITVNADIIDIGLIPPTYLHSGFYPSGTSSWGMRLRGDLSIIGTASNNGISVVDVSKPGFPEEINTLVGGGKNAVEIFDNFAIAASGEQVALIDLSDARDPVLLDTFEPGGTPQIYDLVVDGDYAFVINNETVHVLQIDRTAGTLTEMAAYEYSLAVSFDQSIGGADMQVRGDFLLIRGNDGVSGTALFLLNISDVTAITEAASLAISGVDTDSMEWAGNLVYLGDYDARRILIYRIE